MVKFRFSRLCSLLKIDWMGNGKRRTTLVLTVKYVIFLKFNF